MSKKNLTGVYTAPAHLVEVEEEQEDRHFVTKGDYNNQRYNRKLDMDIQTYKERMALVREANEAKAITNELKEIEPPRKKQKAIEQDDILAEEKAKSDTETPETDLEVKDSKLVPFIPIIHGIQLTDEVLSKLLPPGYVAAAVPEGYSAMVELYVPPETVATADLTELPEFEGIPLKREDTKHFGALVKQNGALTSPDDKRRLRAMELVFRAKNGQPPVRRKALRQLGSSANSLGVSAIFGIVLPLMLEPALEDAERHVLTKLLGRVVYQLDDKVRPYTHKIIAAVAPLLIDEDMTLRLEARDAVSAVSKAAGLANIVASLRPDLDHADEYVRNLTARVFAVVATTLGLVKVLPFVKAVMRLKKSWQARHTGIRIIHHLCVLLGGGNGALIIPYLAHLVEVLGPGLSDELLQVRTATANTFAQLAESVHPYGIEAFEPMLEPAWAGLKHHRGRGLAAFLRCIGSLVPLMSHNAAYSEYSNYYTRELMQVMTREFSSPDDEMRRAMLKVLVTLPVSRTIFPNFRRQVVGPFLQHFWTRRIALDQIARLVVDATALLAQRLDVAGMLELLTPFAKDANENLRRMASDALNKIVKNNPNELVELTSEAALVDAVLYAFQEQNQPHPVYLLTVTTVCRTLGTRLQPHVPVIISTVLYRLKNSDPAIRQQSADLVAAVAPVLGDQTVIRKLILFLYELLGEVYPEVLGSIVSALYGCIDTLDRDTLLALDNPSVNMLLPTLTPILKNRHEKVQEQCIRLVGLIAKKNAESINAREWMRVCFDLLDMLKSQRKRIRVAANATFGHIANTIGPQDVLAMLLNNLRVQERQLRVCTAVAIGIVAETCAPFTVLPALMNEYRVPDKNVQNGVLKALSFLFEYIPGLMTKDYLNAITPLLEDALTDRDQVHRQTAATVVCHIALNCVGVTNDYHDVFVHFLNLVVPNLYELSPHVAIRIVECVTALRVVLGPGVFFNYVWPGLFHAAKKVRAPYWKIYNAAYVQSCDAIVPYYPLLDTMPDTSYNVDELDIWL